MRAVRTNLSPLTRTLIATLMVACTGHAAVSAGDAWPTTHAESTGFRAVGTAAQTLEFMKQLARRWPALRVTEFGRSAAGRPLLLGVVAAGGEFTPATAARSGKPIVLIQSSIHGGEVDGTTASLMLLRELARDVDPRSLERFVLLIAPIYNADGFARVSPWNRPNQNGPIDGMGFRTTADGHDLNRDHLKAVTPEARALLGLINRWRPHLHVDNHVTDGTSHDWVLTWAVAESPQLDPEVAGWAANAIDAAELALRADDLGSGPYVSLIDRSNPDAGFDSLVHLPRYSSGYFPLRHRPSILVENHSYAPFRDRVQANLVFMRALLERVAADGVTLRRAIAAAERRTVDAGRPDAQPSSVVVSWRPALSPPDSHDVPFHAWHSVPSLVTGTRLLEYDDRSPRPSSVPWVHRLEPALTLARPRGYLVLPGWPAIESRLEAHGLRVETLGDELTLEVETIRIAGDAGATDAIPPYQGLVRPVLTVERRREQRRIPPGTRWIPADQPDFEIAVQLFEPEAPDSLAAWGLLSQVLERKEYIESRVLERLAREMLADDDALAREWSAALEDPLFAADGRARYRWWYRRTPYWDRSVGLLPVMRALRAPRPVAKTGP